MMELKVSSESRAISRPDSASDPEEQEVSDDDDDRNHKHLRWDTGSQSLEGDQQEQFFNRPYRKWSKPFDNRYLSKDGNFQSHYNLDREFSLRFEKRQPSMTNISRFPLNANQKLNINPSSCGDLGSSRGRISDSGSWSQCDLRFNPIDLASQMLPPGPIPSAVLSSRGLRSVANAQISPWAGGFEIIPGVPNGVIGTIHPFGLQGSLRTPLNPSSNKGIARQRCRDLEERGYCLRGDMCRMGHGVNHIVVEDVQSLSQFNLPVSLPSAHVLAKPAVSGLDPQANAYPSALINNIGPGIDADGYSLSGALSGVVDGNGADVYDPDQPLWNNDCSETSTGFLSLHAPASFMGSDPSDQLARSSEAAIDLQSNSSSSWGRMFAPKNRLVSREKGNSRVTYSEFSESGSKEKWEMYANKQGESHYGTQCNAGQLVVSSSNLHNDSGRSIKKPAQKASRTICVSCIPSKDNRKDVLLAHFKKIGEVIDINIPLYTGRAFVQFSKREEAERALKSPDAVMGNRFIKLVWANFDSIVDVGGVGGENMAGMHNHTQEALDATHRTTLNASKENIQLVVPEVDAPYSSGSSRAASSEAKPPTSDGPKALSAPPVKRKTENLELLREELRKKQEMLEQKRNEFRQQLDKLQKNLCCVNIGGDADAIGVMGEVPEVQPSKKLKVEGAVDFPKSLTPKHSNLHSSCVDMTAFHNSQPVEIVALCSSKTKLSALSLEVSTLKHTTHPLAYVGSPYPPSRYKLDNRPTSFRVNAPLPTEFANIGAIRDHFLVFGDLSNVDLELSEAQGGDDDDCSETVKNITACVSFKTRQAAERAFVNGKSWNCYSLQLTWVMPTKSGGTPKDKSPAFRRPSCSELQSLEKPASTTNSSSERGSSESATKEASVIEIQSVEKSACDVSHYSCQSSGLGLDSFSGAEAQSADKSSEARSSHEASWPGSMDSEVVEKEGSPHGQIESDGNSPSINVSVT